jgi:hypothetical protein
VTNSNDGWYRITKEDVAEVATAIGEFLIAFQDLSDMVRMCCCNCMLHDGEDMRVAHIIFHEMSERTLIKTFHSLFMNAVVNDNARRVIDELHDQFHQVCDKRNDIVHGNWSVREGTVVSSEGGRPDVLGWKVGPGDGPLGISYKGLPTLSELRELTERARRLEREFLPLIR